MIYLLKNFFFPCLHYTENVDYKAVKLLFRLKDGHTILYNSVALQIPTTLMLYNIEGHLIKIQTNVVQ